MLELWAALSVGKKKKGDKKKLWNEVSQLLWEEDTKQKKIEQLSSSANTEMWVAFAEAAKNEHIKSESTVMV